MSELNDKTLYRVLKEHEKPSLHLFIAGFNAFSEVENTPTPYIRGSRMLTAFHIMIILLILLGISTSFYSIIGIVNTSNLYLSIPITAVGFYGFYKSGKEISKNADVEMIALERARKDKLIDLMEEALVYHKVRMNDLLKEHGKKEEVK